MGNIKDKRTLKELKSQLQVLQGDIEAENVALNNLQHQIRSKQRSLQNLTEKIKELENPVIPKLSEHALFRYCERVLNINFKEIEDEILTEATKGVLLALGGNLKYTHPTKKYTVVFRNNVAVTIE